MSEDPEFFVSEGRAFLNGSPFAELTLKPELTMTGRSYAVGYENDLDEVLLRRPQNRILDPALRWAVWYPVKRTKAFEALPETDKHDVMMDHGEIGKRFGKAGLAHDIRLSCHGLDYNDSDFVIGVLAAELAAASLVVQAMRKSLQTMHHLEGLGPFFTGRVVGQWDPSAR
jgi:chlorite dismutase